MENASITVMVPQDIKNALVEAARASDSNIAGVVRNILREHDRQSKS